ncbi:MAG: hypothetical protein ABR613_10565 [Actinomycetota bacterium]
MTGAALASEIPAPLLGVKAKLDRAGEHFNALNDVVQPFLKRRPYRFTDYFDPNLRIYYLYVEPTEEMPREIGVIMGDVLHNLHSALDHTICALARVHDPMCECTTTEFPIYTDAKEYRKKVGRTLRGVPEGAKAVIEQLQPFNCGDDPNLHILELLRRFSNVDKHRSLHVALGALQAATIKAPRDLGLQPIRFNAGPIEGRTEIAALYVPPHVNSVVEMKVDGAIHVVIDEGKGLWPDNQRALLDDTLYAMFEWIGAKVLPQLEPFVVDHH